MKQNETEYLDKLFASTSDVTGEVEVEFPIVDAPNTLAEKLYRITEAEATVVALAKPRFFESWQNVGRLAAGLVVAFMAFQFYQQQQSLQRLERAQADLVTALHYLGEANRITREQVRSSLNENMKKAGVEPALQIGRDSILPALRSRELEPNPKLERTL